MILNDYKKVKEIESNINKWQKNDYVHPLTCGNDSGHSDLIPEVVEVSEGEYKIELKCKDCDWIQDIPSFIEELDSSFFTDFNDFNKKR